jgi:GWxTD domain-containing protein
MLLSPSLLESQTKNRKIESFLSIGDSLRTLGELKDAKKAYKKALKVDKKSIRAFRGLGQVALKKEDWGDVKKWFKKVLKVLKDDLEAKYYLGIAYRESGKFKSLILKGKDFSSSRKYFDSVIQTDSTFQDILYQRAFLEQLKENWLEAIKWGHRQVNLKPELTNAQIGLFKFYRLFLSDKSDQEVLEWLSSQNGDWPAYFLAEQHRRKGRFAVADSIFQSLLKQDLTISKVPILLSLVRMSIQRDKQEEANKYFQWVLNSIKTNVDAEFLFEDSKYIFKDNELAIFRSLSNGLQKRNFFRSFWVSRDPIPASPENERVLEHYKRLVYAEENYRYNGVRSWMNNPDKVGYLKFPKTYYLNKEFNDKGLVYIRHGAPNDIAKTAGLVQKSNESWRYYRREDRPELIFHFKIAGTATGNNWRLTPYLENRRMLEDRLGWDPTLDRLYYARSQLEYNSVLNRLADESRDVVYAAMSSDYHTWDEKTEFLEMPYSLVNFRGDNGKTRTEISFGISLKELELKSSEKPKRIKLEYGAGIYDAYWNSKKRFFERIELDANKSAQIFKDYFIHRYAIDIEPGMYNFTLYAKEKEPSKIGGWNFRVEVPSFESDMLRLSDLVPAYKIDPADSDSKFAKGDLSIIPNPTKKFILSEPAYLYFEIYNLSKDKNGQTSFEIEHEMTQLKKKRKGITKIFRFSRDGKKTLISIKDKRTGEDSVSIEFASFDVSKLDEGEYELTVRVTDLNSNRTVEKSTHLEFRRK